MRLQIQPDSIEFKSLRYLASLHTAQAVPLIWAQRTSAGPGAGGRREATIVVVARNPLSIRAEALNLLTVLLDPLLRQRPSPHHLLPRIGRVLRTGVRGESMRLELAASGIKLTVVCPGPVGSDLWGKLITGARTDRQAPAGAIAPDAAVKLILAGVAKEQGILVFPARQRWRWRLYRWFPKLTEVVLQAAARRARAADKQKAASTPEKMTRDGAHSE